MSIRQATIPCDAIYVIETDQDYNDYAVRVTHDLSQGKSVVIHDYRTGYARPIRHYFS